MILADHLRLENVLRPIKEIGSVVQSWAHGFDLVTVNLTCCENEVHIVSALNDASRAELDVLAAELAAAYK